jgi:hypothetical protein
MRSGGENGGVKLAAMELLKGLQTQMGDRLQFLFFTADDTHDEVTTLLRERDFASCVLRRSRKGSVSQAIELATCF